jgi:hypothetical protein
LPSAPTITGTARRPPERSSISGSFDGSERTLTYSTVNPCLANASRALEV